MIKLNKELLALIIKKASEIRKELNIPVFDYKKNQVWYIDWEYYYSDNSNLDWRDWNNYRWYSYSWYIRGSDWDLIIDYSKALYINNDWNEEFTEDWVKIKWNNFIEKFRFKFSSEEVLSRYYYSWAAFYLITWGESDLFEVEWELFKFKWNPRDAWFYLFEWKLYSDYSKITSKWAYFCRTCGEFHRKSYDCPKQEYGFNDWQKWFFFDESNGSKFKVWLEIEKDYDLENRLTKQQKLAIKRDNFKLAKDCSCGCEVVSPILDLYQAYDYTAKHPYLVEWNLNTRCWGHIHISEKDVEPSVLLKNIKHYRPILWAIYPERVNNSYCRPSSFGTASRYADMTTTSYWSIEIRIFPWLGSLEQLRFRLELIKFFVENKVDTKKLALHKIFNEKIIDFINILHIVYPTPEEKLAVIQRIAEAYNVPDKRESIIEKTKIFCERLWK